MRSAPLLVLLTLVLASCGNPHLKSEDLVQDVQGVTPGDARDIIVTNADGGRELVIVTADPASNAILGLENRGEIPYTLTVEFERGTHFRWNGGRYPGTNGSCAEVQAAGTRCNFDIEFVATAPGTHTDNLVLTFAPVASPSLTRRLLVPLRGERLVDGLLALNLTNAAGGPALELETSGNLVRGFVNQHNPNSEDVLTQYRFATDVHFRVGTGSTCTGTQASDTTCALEIVFLSNVDGRFTDDLIVTYAARSNPARTREVRLPLVGVRRSGTTPPPPGGCGETRAVVQPNLSSVSHAQIVFPYLSEVPHRNIFLGKLHGTQTNSRVFTLNQRTVRDAQVYVSYDLPAVEGEVSDIFLNVNVSKVIRDDYPNSESLCLSTAGLRTCSGREFTHTSWKDLKNPAFWTSYPGPVNTTYQDEFAKGLARCGRFLCYAMEQTFSAKQLFELSATQLADLKGKPLHLVFSDDTRLRRIPTLTVVVKNPDCRQE